MDENNDKKDDQKWPEISALKFECTGSGKCCVSHGEYGFVFLNKSDIRRLEKFLGVPKEEFAQQDDFDFTRFSKAKKKCWHLSNSEKGCRFLNGKQCSVYEARPIQCRTWPYYPEHMNAKAWSELSQFCPGVGRGPEKTEKEIKDIIDAQLKADEEY